MTTPVYLDHHATTPTDPRVLHAMTPYFCEAFGNPHAVDGYHGRSAADAVAAARAAVAAAIGAGEREIVFTSGATEANNLAVKGALGFALRRRGLASPHVIVAATEHRCVLESCAAMASAGVRVTRLPVAPSGLVSPAQLAAAMTDDTVLVSVMAVNNEIGVIQPLARIGALCRARGILFHSDAAQAPGRMALDVEAQQIDLLSLSGHKVYGPMGIGALYVRRRPRARLEPLFSGGGQERGLRPGTLPTALCVGLGLACELAVAERETESARLAGLRDRLLARLTGAVPGLRVHGDRQARVAGNLSIGVPGLATAPLLAALSGEVTLSAGSACSTGHDTPSHVLTALGVDPGLARGSLRIGLGRFTTREETDHAADRLAAAILEQRAAGDRPAGQETG